MIAPLVFVLLTLLMLTARRLRMKACSRAVRARFAGGWSGGRDLRLRELQCVCHARLDVPEWLNLARHFASAVRRECSDLWDLRDHPCLVLAAALCAARACHPVLPDAELIGAAALRSARYYWSLPRRARNDILRACGAVEWETAHPARAAQALQVALENVPSMAVYRRLLGALAACHEWDGLIGRALRCWRYYSGARRALGGPEGNPLIVGLFERAPWNEGLLAAELVARARIELGLFDRRTAEGWVLPLIRLATGRYLSRVQAARFLCDHLNEMPTPQTVVEAIESGISPRDWDDYSNFREAFSLNSWTIVRSHLKSAAIATELECFVTESDRRSFWRYFLPGDSK